VTVVLLVFVALLAVINWVCAAILVRAARAESVPALSERASAAVVIAGANSLYLLITINTQLDFVFLSLAEVTVLMRLMFIGLGIVPIRWLYLYFSGRFR
jgi:hypothetical protein